MSRLWLAGTRDPVHPVAKTDGREWATTTAESRCGLILRVNSETVVFAVCYGQDRALTAIETAFDKQHGNNMPFEKGVSGNPKGRPKHGTALTDILRSKLDKRDAEGVRPRDAIAEDLLSLTRHPDPNVRLKAIAYVYDRIDGKPKQALEHSGDPEHPIGIGVQAIDYRNSIAALAPAPSDAAGPMDDSESPGEG